MAEQTYEIIQHTQINEIALEISEFFYQNPHRHHDMEVVLVLDGAFHVQTDTEEHYEAAAGDLLVFDPYVLHTFLGHAAQCRVLTIHIQRSFCAGYFPALETICFETSRVPETEKYSAMLRRAVFQLGYNYFGRDFGFELRCYSDLNMVIYLLLQCMPYAVHRELPETVARHRSRMQRILRFIEENYTQPVTLGMLAEREGLTASYLSHFIKAHIGISFQDYVTMLRFERAVQLLLQTDRKIVDICGEAGFSESKYLNRIFEEQFHMKPKEFRRLAQKNRMGTAQEIAPGRRVLRDRETCLEILRSHFHYACDEPEKADLSLF